MKKKKCNHRFTQAQDQKDLTLFCWKCGEVQVFPEEDLTAGKLGFVLGTSAEIPDMWGRDDDVE